MVYEVCCVEIGKDVPCWLFETLTSGWFACSVKVCICDGWTLCMILLMVPDSPKKFIRAAWAMAALCWLLIGCNSLWYETVWANGWLVSEKFIALLSVVKSSKSLRCLESFKLLSISLKYDCHFCHWYVIVQKLWRVLLILRETYFLFLLEDWLSELWSLCVFLFLFELGQLNDTTTSSKTSVEVELSVESIGKVSFSIWSVWTAWEFCW